MTRIKMGEEKQTEMIPVPVDRHTVVYARRKNIEKRGGVEGYAEWFRKNRAEPKASIRVLYDL
ncbi:MAG: hypothetical protein LBP50_09775 [Tannerella sp.]|jgi:hypothetical protein|nr:hypothetical protein [Tannerella sp.]